MANIPTNEWIRSNAPYLYQRHVVERRPAYCSPTSEAWPGLTRERQWLKARSISPASLRQFMKVSEASRLLGIGATGLRSAIQKGGIRGPILYDYSRYSTTEHYELWVLRKAVDYYKQTRLRSRR